MRAGTELKFENYESVQRRLQFSGIKRGLKFHFIGTLIDILYSYSVRSFCLDMGALVFEVVHGPLLMLLGQVRLIDTLQLSASAPIQG